jgi:hypothetical protein
MKPFNEHNESEWTFKKSKQNLHGDVIVEKINDLPADFESMKAEPQGALAYGEHTGHLHKLFRMQDPDLMDAVSFDLRIDKAGNRWLKVEAKTAVKHQEHSPRVIPPGFYKIGIQREYDPFTKLARQVQD